MNYLLTLCCCTAVWAKGFGLVTQVLEVLVMGGGGGGIRVLIGLLGCLRVHILSLGPVFSYVSITDFTKIVLVR